MLSSLVDSMKTKYTEVSVNFIFLVNDEKEEEKSPLLFLQFPLWVYSQYYKIKKYRIF
jgi:hypothetical protein